MNGECLRWKKGKNRERTVGREEGRFQDRENLGKNDKGKKRKL